MLQALHYDLAHLIGATVLPQPKAVLSC